MSEERFFMPYSCSECIHYSGDGYNDCCNHPDLIDDGFNINARPERCRMKGCPIELRIKHLQDVES